MSEPKAAPKTVPIPAQEGAFWEGRRVMVTGGAGFLGTAVVRQQRGTGATAVVIPQSEDSFGGGLRLAIRWYESTRDVSS